MGTQVAMGGGGKGSRDWAALGASRGVGPLLDLEADRTELHRLDVLQVTAPTSSTPTARTRKRIRHKSARGEDAETI